MKGNLAINLIRDRKAAVYCAKAHKLRIYCWEEDWESHLVTLDRTLFLTVSKFKLFGIFGTRQCPPPKKKIKITKFFCPKICVCSEQYAKSIFQFFTFWDMVDFVLKILGKLSKKWNQIWPILFFSQNMRNVLKLMRKQFYEFYDC